jgi:hypothetical protein
MIMAVSNYYYVGLVGSAKAESNDVLAARALQWLPNHNQCAMCNFPRENEELSLEQELSRQGNSKIGTT